MLSVRLVPRGTWGRQERERRKDGHGYDRPDAIDCDGPRPSAGASALLPQRHGAWVAVRARNNCRDAAESYQDAEECPEARRGPL
jgi:hypothetical protein